MIIDKCLIMGHLSLLFDGEIEMSIMAKAALRVLEVLIERSPSNETTKFLEDERDELLIELGMKQGGVSVSKSAFEEISE